MPATAVLPAPPTRDAIVQAAEEFVGTGAFDRLTLNAIARKLGTDVEQVKQVFPARRHLVEAVCVARHEVWFTALTRSLPADADPRDRILLVFAYLEQDAEGCCPCRSGLRGTESVAASLASGHLLEVEHLVSTLCAKAGLPSLLCDALVVLVEGATVASMTKGSVAPVLAARTAAAMLMSVYEPDDVDIL